MDLTTNSPTLSVELRALIDKRNILTTRSKSKVLNALDRQISKDREYKHQQLKSRAIEEIFTSEVSYLNQLEITMKFFKRPLHDSKFILPPELKCVFDHLESVYNVNGELLNQLRTNGDDVATAFRKVAPFFKLYSVYAYNYRHAVSALQDLHKSNHKLDAFIKRQESRPEVKSKLSSLLIAPIQRIPRYRLLLKELLSHTPDTHEHHTAMIDALKEVEASTEHINTLVQEQENMQRLVELQKSMVGGKPTIVCPGRKLIKEGILMKVSKNGKKAHQRYFVLLSDIILYSKVVGPVIGEASSLRCSCVLPLRKCFVHHVLGDKVFNISCPTFTLVLYSEDSQCSEEWVHAIRRAIEQEEEGKSTLNRRGSTRLPLTKKDLNSMTETLTPRKRKQQQSDLEDVCLPFHSPWKRNKVTSSTPIKEPPSEEGDFQPRRPGYFSSVKKAIMNFGHSLHKFWLPMYTGRDGNMDRRLMN